MAKIVKFIETHERVGRGVEGDPVRRVYQLWTLEGELVYEKDPCKKE